MAQNMFATVAHFFLAICTSQALAPNHIWTLDFVHDSLRHGRRIRMLSVVDEFTREAMQIHVDYSLKAQDVQQVLGKLFRERGAPCYLRSDNGSEFIERALNKWLKSKGTDSIFITPGSPWKNGLQPLPIGLRMWIPEG